MTKPNLKTYSIRILRARFPGNNIFLMYAHEIHQRAYILMCSYYQRVYILQLTEDLGQTQTKKKGKKKNPLCSLQIWGKWPYLSPKTSTETILNSKGNDHTGKCTQYEKPVFSSLFSVSYLGPFWCQPSTKSTRTGQIVSNLEAPPQRGDYWLWGHPSC